MSRTHISTTDGTTSALGRANIKAPILSANSSRVRGAVAFPPQHKPVLPRFRPTCLRGEFANSISRVRRCCRQHPLPSELHGRHFDACSSSIEQRPCEIRPGTAPPAHDTPYGTRLPHWPWGQPGRYCGSAGYRDDSVAGAAPARIVAIPPTDLLCPLRRLADGSRPPTPEGSLPAFAWGDVCNPYPARLQAGLRFLPRPLPAAPSARLAARLPSREDYGLTTLHRRNPRGLGPASTPVALHLRRVTLQHPDLATYLLVQACQHLWLVSVHDACGGSPGLTVPRAPGPRPPWCWQSRSRLTLRSPPSRVRIRCPEGFAPRRCQRRTPR